MRWTTPPYGTTAIASVQFTVPDRCRDSTQILAVFSATAAHSVPDTIASGDLDGDMYFVCWDPSLIPPREAAPFSRAPSAAPAARANAARRLSDMPQAAIDTFIQLKFSRLLGMMSNAWTSQVELTPQLADDQYCRELAPLIESALVRILRNCADVKPLYSFGMAGYHEIGRGLGET